MGILSLDICKGSEKVAMLTQVPVTVSQQLRQKTHEQCIGYNILILLLKLTPESESKIIDFCVLLQITTTQTIIVLLLK